MNEMCVWMNHWMNEWVVGGVESWVLRLITLTSFLSSGCRMCFVLVWFELCLGYMILLPTQGVQKTHRIGKKRRRRKPNELLPCLKSRNKIIRTDYHCLGVVKLSGFVTTRIINATHAHCVMRWRNIVLRRWVL